MESFTKNTCGVEKECRVVLRRDSVPGGSPVRSFAVKHFTEGLDIGSPGADSDSSLQSMVTVSSATQSPERRKRGRPHTRKRDDDESHSSSDSGSDAPAPKVVAVKPRGRGRPPTTGHYVGLAKAKRELAEAELLELQLEAEREVARGTRTLARHRRECEAQASPLAGPRAEMSVSEPEDVPLAYDIEKTVMESVNVIELVAAKSKNLKGTSVRALKDAATLIKKAARDFKARTSSDETKRLQAANERLRAEMADLRQEMAELRREVAQARRVPTPPISGRTSPSKSPTKAPNRWRNCAWALPAPEEPHTRPPLAADRRNLAAAAAPTSEPQPGPSGATAVVKETGPSPSAPRGKKSAKGPKPGGDGPQLAKVQPGVSWVEVAKRGRKGKAAAAVATPAPAQGPPSQAEAAPPRRPARKAAKPRIRAPTTSAVVLTITPKGAEKGITYQQAMRTAQQRIKIAELGIESLTNIRRAATGGRVLEVQGKDPADRERKTDVFAERLRQVLGEDVRVTRPMKCADLRITGLDDATTGPDVAAAIAEAGACQLEWIRAGEVRRTAAGMGTVFVRCPVSAAKKVATAGRLLVGWVSARVKLLAPKPMRCFRCLEVGHVREQCPAETDRSTLCYRCGQSGHKASGCSAAPHCVVCAAADKPAGHRMGEKACAPPPKKRRVRGKAARPASQPTPMDCPPAPCDSAGTSGQSKK